MDDATHARRAGLWRSEQETSAFGHALAQRLERGDCIALVGEMGTGKTTLTRAIAEGCGVDVAAEFSSPTYTYANEYAASLPFVHMDLYRVADLSTAEALGLIELAARPDAVVVIEWAARLPRLVAKSALWLSLSDGEGDACCRHWQAHGLWATVGRLCPEPA